jgi:ribosomal protein S18 acetylase RimI-like enzyme
MTSSFTIRRAHLGDATAIARVHTQVWKENYNGIINQSYLDALLFKDEDRRDVLSHQDARKATWVACNQQREIVGFCDFGRARSHDHILGEVYALYLLKEYQRIGIGSTLWRQAKNHFSHLNLIPYCVWVLRENRLARQFYEKHNGKLQGEEIIALGSCVYWRMRYLFK